MRLLSSSALWWLLLAAIIVFFYLLKSDGKGDGTEPSPATTPVAQSRDQSSGAIASEEPAKGDEPLATRLLDAKRKRRE